MRWRLCYTAISLEWNQWMFKCRLIWIIKIFYCINEEQSEGRLRHAPKTVLIFSESISNTLRRAHWTQILVANVKYFQFQTPNEHIIINMKWIEFFLWVFDKGTGKRVSFDLFLTFFVRQKRKKPIINK